MDPLFLLLMIFALIVVVVVDAVDAAKAPDKDKSVQPKRRRHHHHRRVRGRKPTVSPLLERRLGRHQYNSSTTTTKNRLTPSAGSISKPPITTYVLFKTYKTGGTSMTAMALRYAHLGGHLVCVPTYGASISYTAGQQACSPVKSSGHPHPSYRVWASHPTRYRAERVASLLPSEAAWLTILREPVHRFLSWWHWVPHVRRRKQRSATLRQSRHRYDKNRTLQLDTALRKVGAAIHGDRAPVPRIDGWHSLGMSPLMALGVQPHDPDPLTLMDRAKDTAKHMRQRFDVVLLLERLPESLVLMRRHMHWSLMDVVPVHHKRIDAGDVTPHDDLSPYGQRALRHMLRFEQVLYDEATKMLDNRLADQPCVEEEIALLHCIEANVTLTCRDANMLSTSIDDDGRVPAGSRQDWCLAFVREPLIYYRLLRDEYRNRGQVGPRITLLNLQARWERELYAGTCSNQLASLESCIKVGGFWRQHQRAEAILPGLPWPQHNRL
jgi:hypothetical protein